MSSDERSGVRARSGGEYAAQRFHRSKFGKRLKRLEGIGVELPLVENAGTARAGEHVVAGNLGPKVFDLARFGEETVAADVEAKSFVVDRPRNTADILGIALKHEGGRGLLGEFIGSREASRSGADDCGLENPLRHGCPVGDSP